jgi:hypothetical protein
MNNLWFQFFKKLRTVLVLVLVPKEMGPGIQF